jgi:hypothetical protein
VRGVQTASEEQLRTVVNPVLAARIRATFMDNGSKL